eukprot:TRINITY_DN7782_c0_g1_i1.p1 TRINITY_DN7782_c0_g1~~TRINITY_DN7782_c0_g1_i1.p1  ORF type:complete len:298 (+),score=35.48 TRINITY_DN7782_c0_g1_i1:83-976(+)
MSALSLSGFVLLTLALSDGLQVLQSDTISFQLHSFNDLREWPQLLTKGGAFFKIDGHYRPYSFCKTLPRRIYQQQLNDSRGCLLMNHDPPLESGVTYFSHLDLYGFVADEDSRRWFNSSARIFLYLHGIADNDAYPRINTFYVQQLLSEWALTMEMIVRQLNLNAEVIVEPGVLNGPAAIYYPSESDITNKSSCLYSNDGACQFQQILNGQANPIPFENIALWIDALCPVQFGKFLETKYPWVYWEPTDQFSIFEVLDSYLQCGLMHQPGLQIAINIDTPVRHSPPGCPALPFDLHV